MPEHPAELPEGESGGGGGRIPRRPGGIGGPNELPIDWMRISASQLISEVFRLRDRVHALESNNLAVRMRAGGRSFFNPAEMPVPEGEGGGGGGWHFPPEIHEIHEINELPISQFVTELTGLVARFTQFERQVTQQLATIAQRLDTMKK
jgi:hypothetical protein